MYEDILAHLSRVEAAGQPPLSLRPFSPEALDARRRRHSGIPEDYLAYLGEVGSGRIWSAGFGIFGELIEPSYFLEGVAGGHDSYIVCFGQSYPGPTLGFRTDTWGVVEIECSTGEVTKLDEPFAVYIRRRVGVSANP